VAINNNERQLAVAVAVSAAAAASSRRPVDSSVGGLWTRSPQGFIQSHSSAARRRRSAGRPRALSYARTATGRQPLPARKTSHPDPMSVRCRPSATCISGDRSSALLQQPRNGRPELRWSRRVQSSLWCPDTIGATLLRSRWCRRPAATRYGSSGDGGGGGIDWTAPGERQSRMGLTAVLV
jgi:hypothetical protein